jgi:hypothetical protein
VTKDDRHNSIAGVLLVLGLGLLCWFWCDLLVATSGERVGAFGAIIGGMIGAGGAVFAVYFTLARQRSEDIEKVRAAVRTEVTTYSKYVISALEICEIVANNPGTLPISDAPSIADSLVAPIVYPAVADRVGLLPRAQQTIEFYMRIAEVKAMLTAFQRRAASLTNNQAASRTVQPYEVGAVADALITALQLVKPIIADHDNSRTQFDLRVQEKALRDIDEALASAKLAFPDAEAFQYDQPTPQLSA